MDMERENIEFEGDETASYSDFLHAVEKQYDPESNSVLLIDDERGIRRKVSRDVKSFDPDIQIFEAGNGQEGLEQLEKIRRKYSKDPLFIVLDLNMPVMNGWEFVKVLKKEYESKGEEFGIPIIVLSSTSGETGSLFLKKSVQEGKSGYNPLVTVAKEVCVDNSRYDAKDEKGLLAWLKYFMEER